MLLYYESDFVLFLVKLSGGGKVHGGREQSCWSVVVSSREQSRRKWILDESETPPVRIRRIRIGDSFVLSRYRGEGR
ncbi:hypothetical protein YC2023_061037 [Brassica napus]